ncbi:MAG TPA: RlmE family RNA methyltransferase [bacterium]
MKKVQDHYFRQAKREGFAARSAFKLEEIDKRQRLLRTGMHVLDLGCAPGSWLQYAAERVGPSGRVLGIDLQPVTIALPGHVRAMQGDAFNTPPEALLADGRSFDVVVSDMAPKTTGIPSADAARSAELVLRALAVAQGVLKPGGTLLAKVFQGSRTVELRTAFAQSFDKVSIEKPKASRSESVEVFLLGQGFRPASASPQEGRP